MRGVQVGRVGTVTGAKNQVSLKLEIDPDQIKYIPANVQARIRAGTLFGAKFVELVYPERPQPRAAGCWSGDRFRNVSTESQHRVREPGGGAESD